MWPKLGKKFWQRLSSGAELQMHAEGTPLQAAKRFASKEACAKALGVGIGTHLRFQDITIQHGHGRKPTLSVCNAVLEKIIPHNPDKIQLDLSLSDEYPYVQSFVVISLLHV